MWCSREQKRKESVLLWGKDGQILHHRVLEPVKSKDACHLGSVCKAKEIACAEARRCEGNSEGAGLAQLRGEATVQSRKRMLCSPLSLLGYLQSSRWTQGI